MKTKQTRIYVKMPLRFVIIFLFFAFASFVGAQTLKQLYSFSFSDGSHPGVLTLGPDGNCYGTTFYGGSYGSGVFYNYGYGYGTVFRMTTNGTLTTLVEFNFTNGAYPSDLTLGNDGKFYGTTQNGGNYGCGTVFVVTTNGALTTLLDFDGTNGVSPGKLALGGDGSFYGNAGSSSKGGDISIVFKVTTNGALTTVVKFRSDGNNPSVSSNLTLGRDGNFYCVGNSGRLCKLTPDGILTTVASFPANFEDQLSNLTLGTDGNFYFTARAASTIYQLTTNGTLTTFASFNNIVLPGDLTLGSEGNFYGTTVGGGIEGDGTVFQVTTNGALAILVNINSEYWESRSALTLGSDGNFYGTTTDGSGGVDGDGLIFSMLIPLTISVQPQSQTNYAGTTVTFLANAIGPNPISNPLSYQWQKNGTNLVNGGNISGATNNTLTIKDISDSDAADYSLIVSNMVNNVTSSNVTLTVNDSPFITSQPQPQAVTNGHSASFVVAANGKTSLAYQWQFNATNLNGATNATLTLQNAFPDNAGAYTVAITNTYGSVTSNPAILTVFPLDINAPTILASGQFQFSFDTATGVNYEVQYSTNLTQWFPLVTLGGIGVPLTLIDPNTVGRQQGFYRISLSPP
jgi:uncharacterized repeat protein (TIGR03803 family)